MAASLLEGASAGAKVVAHGHALSKHQANISPKRYQNYPRPLCSWNGEGQSPVCPSRRPSGAAPRAEIARGNGRAGDDGRGLTRQ